jgi:hypothetical protein
MYMKDSKERWDSKVRWSCQTLMVCAKLQWCDSPKRDGSTHQSVMVYINVPNSDDVQVYFNLQIFSIPLSWWNNILFRWSSILRLLLLLTTHSSRLMHASLCSVAFVQDTTNSVVITWRHEHWSLAPLDFGVSDHCTMAQLFFTRYIGEGPSHFGVCNIVKIITLWHRPSCFGVSIALWSYHRTSESYIYIPRYVYIWKRRNSGAMWPMGLLIV